MHRTGHELSAATRRWMHCVRCKIFAAVRFGCRTFFAFGHNMECGQQSSTKIIGGMIMCNNNGICGCFSGNNWWWIIVLLLIFCNCGGCGNNTFSNDRCGCDNNCGCC